MIDTEPVPQAATEMFGERLGLAQRYAEHLASTGVEWGLIGPHEASRIWSRHILNCAVVASLIGPDDVVGDIGSGAGLPGIPLAIAAPQTRFVLVDAMERRVEWLTDVIADLGLENVRVVRERVEDLVDEEVFTAATARAVKPLAVLLEWCVPVLGPGGRLLALKGDKASEEIMKAKKQVRRLHMREPVLHVLGQDMLDVPTRVVEVQRR